MTLRTRFAPSPTGQLHIGNVRTALYNWLVARHHGGQFLLRLEDTDRARSTPEAVQTVFDELAWLGLDVDEDPVYQSQRRDAHLAAAEDLLQRNLAYRSDFGKPEQGTCIVFRMPGTTLSFDDEIKGTLSKAPEDMKDLVLVRSDGSPVFHLANVVDDIHMRINLVIRGDDHIENTYRHVALYQALGAELPRFAHLPMIVNQQGKPYAKRDGDAFIGDFRARGFLPQTMVNFLTLLGWHPDDEREVMTPDELVAAFDLHRVQYKPAQVDLKKLQWMNGEHLHRLDPAARLEGFAAALDQAGIEAPPERLQQVVQLMGERLKFFHDITTSAACFFTDDYPIDEKNWRKRMQREGVADVLRALRETLATTEPFTAAALEPALLATAEAQQLNPGQWMAPLRLATTGQAGGPGLYETLELLGRTTTLDRIDRAL